MTQLAFFLEEPSAREMLKGLLPRLLPDTAGRYVVFEGKQDLEKQLPRKLKAWRSPATAFVVIRDQDAGDCLTIKQQLATLCAAAGKPETLIRIACRELESWYLGDLQAVEKGLAIKGLARQQNRAKYRTPDKLASPAKELRTCSESTASTQYGVKKRLKILRHLINSVFYSASPHPFGAS